MNVAFNIPGQPVPKGRPKFARRGAHVLAYTPAKTVSYENAVRLAATVAMAGAEPVLGPVALSLTLNLQIPASWSNKRRAMAAAGTIAATKKARRRQRPQGHQGRMQRHRVARRRPGGAHPHREAVFGDTWCAG